jgi:5S rRNA maturation endonuclease (ribonuclease M5)
MPKWQSNKGAEAGFLIPHDLIDKSVGVVYIFEGEKDMAMARSLGINGCTLTGGAGATPNNYALGVLKGRDVIICYDNDDAGRDGVKHLTKILKKVCTSVKYVNLAPVCVENKEDFWDFINKYHKDAFDFYDLPAEGLPEEEIKRKKTPIKFALESNIISSKLVADVIVSAEYSDNYAIPSIATFEKVEDTKNGNMVVGETKTWYLNKDNLKQYLELIEVSAKKQEVTGKLKGFVGADKDGIKSDIGEYRTVFKIRVMDKEESSDKFALDIYSFTPMVVGRTYEIEYTIHPHPTKNQKLVAIADEVVDIDAYMDFKPSMEQLNKFHSKGAIADQVDYLYQNAKHHIAPHLNKNLWLMSDLVFNSILEFDYGGLLRGALDVFILGDTQVGKSETTSKLTELYQFGHFLSLKTSTTVGLIGGSNKGDGSWLNTIGAIPRQHKGLAVMEEFSGAKPEFIKTMTDIRSSGKLRLARAAGELNVPCRLRMITISNPINDDNGNPRFLSTFPNGVMPLMELIKSAEDVARYDGFLLVEKVKSVFNPFASHVDLDNPIPKEAYEHKIRWVATRKVQDVVFKGDTKSYIWEKAMELNGMFESNFPLFSTTTTDKKLARFSVAMAALLVSTDATYEKVIVTKEIVDYVVQYLTNIYDNNAFKLKEYKQEFDSYNLITPSELNELQRLYPHNSTLLDFLNNQSSTSRTNLMTISGLERDDFTKLFNVMVRTRLVRLQGETVFPTEKLRLGMRQINRNVRTDAGKIEVIA